VVDILQLLSTGMSTDEVLTELPDLETEDVRAALLYASQRLDHPILAA
jgi:uncharacterized protein (DUF433 family)